MRVFMRFFMVAAVLVFTTPVLAGAESYADLVNQYKAAIASNNPARIKAAWAKLNKSKAAVRYLKKSEPQLYKKYRVNDPAAYDKAMSAAKGRIDKARSALESGDKSRIKRATLEAQSDPLAVREINRNESDTFKGQVKSEVNAVKAKAKELIKQGTAQKYGVKPEDVTFLEATNPPKINPETGRPVEKVGQDWDVTPRVKGKDVPVKEVKQIVHDSYHEAATGEKPPSAKGMTDVEHQRAMEDYRQRANETAHRQAVEVVNRTMDEAYGGSQKEGTEILTGPKGQDLRDPQQISEVIEHKSNKALVKAKQYERVGDSNAAQGEHMEQARQFDKQYDAQIKPRVEARGYKVPEHVQEGAGVLKKVAEGEISPAEGRAQLGKMGETPETIINKASGLVEASQKDKTPQQILDRAKAGKTPRDVFTDNVKNNMELKRLKKAAEAGSPEIVMEKGAGGERPGADVGARPPDTKAGPAKAPVGDPDLAKLAKPGKPSMEEILNRNNTPEKIAEKLGIKKSTGGAPNKPTRVQDPDLAKLAKPERTHIQDQSGDPSLAKLTEPTPDELAQRNKLLKERAKTGVKPPGPEDNAAQSSEIVMEKGAGGERPGAGEASIRTGRSTLSDVRARAKASASKAGIETPSTLESGKSSFQEPTPGQRAAGAAETARGAVERFNTATAERMGIGELPPNAGAARRSVNSGGQAAMEVVIAADTLNKGVEIGSDIAGSRIASRNAARERAKAEKARAQGNMASAQAHENRAAKYDKEASEKGWKAAKEGASFTVVVGVASNPAGVTALTALAAEETGRGWSARINMEEARKEMERAKAAGEKPSAARAKANAAKRIAKQAPGAVAEGVWEVGKTVTKTGATLERYVEKNTETGRSFANAKTEGASLLIEKGREVSAHLRGEKTESEKADEQLIRRKAAWAKKWDSGEIKPLAPETTREDFLAAVGRMANDGKRASLQNLGELGDYVETDKPRQTDPTTQSTGSDEEPVTAESLGRDIQKDLDTLDDFIAGDRQRRREAKSTGKSREAETTDSDGDGDGGKRAEDEIGAWIIGGMPPIGGDPGAIYEPAGEMWNGDIGAMRNAERETDRRDSAGRDDGNDTAIQVAQAPGAADSAISAIRSASSGGPSNAESTNAERVGASNARNDRDNEKIKSQGAQTEHNTAEGQEQNTSAEEGKAADRENNAVIADAVAGGLTSGVAGGVDAGMSVIGGAAGNQVSKDAGIAPKPTEGHHNGSGGTDRSSDDLSNCKNIGYMDIEFQGKRIKQAVCNDDPGAPTATGADNTSDCNGYVSTATGACMSNEIAVKCLDNKGRPTGQVITFAQLRKLGGRGPDLCARARKAGLTTPPPKAKPKHTHPAAGGAAISVTGSANNNGRFTLGNSKPKHKAQPAPKPKTSKVRKRPPAKKRMASAKHCAWLKRRIGQEKYWSIHANSPSARRASAKLYKRFMADYKRQCLP